MHCKVLFVFHDVLGEAKVDAVLGPLLLFAPVHRSILSNHKQVVARELGKVVVDTADVLLELAVGWGLGDPSGFGAISG